MKRSNPILNYALLTAAFVLLSAAVPRQALSQVPHLINYQGRLMDGVGMPVSDGSLPVTFSLWDGATGGSMLWSESQAVAVQDGIYSVILGDSVAIPASAMDNTAVYLEISILSETLSPRQRLTSVPYALKAEQAQDSDLLDGQHGSFYLDAANINAGTLGEVYFSSYSDLVTEGYLDNNAADDLITQSQGDARYVNTEGDDAMAGNFTVGQDLTVSGGNLQLGNATSTAYGIGNSSLNPPSYGAGLYGVTAGVRGMWSTNPFNYGLVGGSYFGVYGTAGTSGSTVIEMGGLFEGKSRAVAYGVMASGHGYGASSSYGIYATGTGDSVGNAYGGFLRADHLSGAGMNYGLYAYGSDFAAWLEGGRVHVGNSGSMTYVDGDGDLYVKDELEVDGVAHFSGGIDAPGAIDASDVNFNYAGSSSPGGMASDSDLLDGQDSTSFAPALHTHSGDDIVSGMVGNGYFSAYSDLSAEGYLDNSASGDLITQSQGDTRYVNTEGDDAMAGNFTVGQDLTVSGGNLVLGDATSTLYGIMNSSVNPPSYGAGLFGTSGGVRAVCSGSPSNYGVVGTPYYGVYGTAGTSGSTINEQGGFFEAESQATAYGVAATGHGYGASSSYGIYGMGWGDSVGTAYGGYFYANHFSGPGLNYGLYAYGSDYAARFEGGLVHVGIAGVTNYVDGDGDLYVKDELEVDGVAHFLGDIDAPNSIDSSDVNFNYAGSASKGGIANDSDLLDGQHGTFYRNATNINAGTLGTGYYSSYSDLGAEGYLDNNAADDIITQSQGDSRYVTKWETWASDLSVTGDVTVSGGNVGIGIAPSSTYGIRNDSASAPGYGANLYGTSYGVYGSLASDPADHYGYIGTSSRGAYGRAGNTDETDMRWGGQFYAYSQGDAYGVEGRAYGYGSLSAIGSVGYGRNDASGGSYGVFGNGVKSTGSGNAYGVVGSAYNYMDGNATGGSFSASNLGTGTHYGIYAEADDYAAWLQNGKVHVGSTGTENYVDGNGDLYVQDELEADGDAYIGGDLTVTGANIGLGVAANSSYGIVNASAAAPAYGAYFYGSASGLFGRLSTDSSDHYGYIGSEQTGVYGRAGNSDEVGTRYGGQFYAYSQDIANGVSGSAWGYSVGVATGLNGYGRNDYSGLACGVYGYGYKFNSVDTSDVYGIDGYAYNNSAGDAYGGYFTTSNAGTGLHYGVYATSDNYPAWFEWNSDPADHYAYLTTNTYGIFANAGNSDESSTRYGGYLRSYSQSYAYGVMGRAYGYGTSSALGVYGYANNSGGGDAYAVYGYALAGAGGTAYGIYNALGTKNWVNPDPEDPEKAVAYVTVESGENVTYYASRGKLVNGRAEIALPDHFRKVTSSDHPVVVQLTPRSLDTPGLGVVESDNAHIVVGELMHGTGNFEFDYTVKGMRLGYEEYEPLIDNVDYVPFQGNQAGLDEAEISTQEFYDQHPESIKRIFKANGTLTADGKVNEGLFHQKGWKMIKVKKEKNGRR